jgi:hypothetical protein
LSARLGAIFYNRLSQKQLKKALGTWEIFGVSRAHCNPEATLCHKRRIKKMKMSMNYLNWKSLAYLFVLGYSVDSWSIF